MMARITIENLTVEFEVIGAYARSIKNTLLSQATGGRLMALAQDVVKVRSLDEVSLQIVEGDRVALRGHNGAGKTTLLRALAGIYKPTGGRIEVTGKVGVILDTTAGLDPESTGLQNIFLRGLMLGMRKREIDQVVDEIADFTELGDFLSLPMRTYSAGMVARLAFGISTAGSHDILLIDEAIGAGDADFQVKVQRRIEAVFNRTPIVVVASHDAALTERICNRSVRLEHGRVIADVPSTAPMDLATSSGLPA